MNPDGCKMKIGACSWELMPSGAIGGTYGGAQLGGPSHGLSLADRRRLRWASLDLPTWIGVMFWIVFYVHEQRALMRLSGTLVWTAYIMLYWLVFLLWM